MLGVCFFFFGGGGELNKRLDDVIFDGLDKDSRDMIWMIVGKQCVEFDFWYARDHVLAS